MLLGCENPLVNRERALERLEPMLLVQNLAHEKCIDQFSANPESSDAERTVRSLHVYYGTLHGGLNDFMKSSPKIDPGLKKQLEGYGSLAGQLESILGEAIAANDFSKVANGDAQLDELMREHDAIEKQITEYLSELVD